MEQPEIMPRTAPRNVMFARAGAFALAAFASLSLAACDTGGGVVATSETAAASGIKVDFPTPPTFSDLDQPLTHPDGTLTVYGLRKYKEMEKHLGKEVKVKAYLLDVYQCPVCPPKQVKEKTCKLCEQPHFFLSDKPDGKKEKALMVVDYLAPKQKPPFLTIGKQYDVEGTFSRNSPTGFASSDGLLQFTRMTDDKNVEFLSPTAQQEAKMLAGAAAEQAAFDKAAKIKAAAQK